jgi:hypothetical protein
MMNAQKIHSPFTIYNRTLHPKRADRSWLDKTNKPGVANWENPPAVCPKN